MADDQKPKTMDINDLVRELSKSSTSPAAPTPIPQTLKPPFPTSPSMDSGPLAKPPMPPPMAPRSTPPPPVPTKPEMPKPQFNVSPQPFNQPKPAPAPSPTAPLPTPGVKEYQSSIRTMNEDISKLKQGQQPMGVPVPRKVEQVVPATPPPPMPPKPAMPSQQFKVPSVNLGETQKSAPIAPPKTVPGINVPKIPSAPKAGGPAPAPKIYVPQEEQKGGNRDMLFIGIGVVVLVAGFSYWFFVLRTLSPEVVIETPTPTPTVTPTPILSPLAKLGIVEKVSIPSTSVFLTALTAEMNARRPAISQIKLFDIVDENQSKYSFKEFLTKLSIDTSTLNDSTGLLDTKEWVFGLYGQLGSSTARPFIVITQKDNDSATTLMNAWEPKMISDLAKLFNISNPSSNLAFTSDVYSNINFRFVRIPDKDLGVAYAIFQNYLILGSSRDSFRAVIDALVTP